jgi:hypothetical protein
VRDVADAQDVTCSVDGGVATCGIPFNEEKR